MSEGAASSRLVIVDDHEMVRGGIKKILAGADDFTVVGEAAQGDEALRVCALVRPDLASSTSNSAPSTGFP